MSETLSLIVNDKALRAQKGMRVLDAVRAAGITMPHDCQQGWCEACRVRIDSGSLDAAGTAIGNSVLACRARLTGDVALRFDPQPKEMKTSGIVRHVTALSPDLIEVMVQVNQPVPYLPGQYVVLTSGKEAEFRACPTLSLEGLRDIDTLHFHINARTNPKARTTLTMGKRINLRGPFGQGFLRRDEGRIVLVSSGTGFAGIWSIAVAARLGQPHRPLALVVSAHDPRNLYMRPALEWLAKHGVTEMVLTASGAHPMPPTRYGRASDYLPALLASDHVYVHGHPDMVRAVQRLAHQAGARCYGQPLIHEPPVEQAQSGPIARFFGL